MQSTQHILVVDDAPASQSLLRIALHQAGYIVQVVGTGQMALELYGASDLVLLDSWLPDVDGFTVCLEIRKRSYVPIVMLSPLNHTEAVLYAFSVGVDDYITKPYRMAEVLLRLQAVLRRCAWHAPCSGAHILGTPELLLNDTLHEVWVRGTLVAVTPLQYQVLRVLMSHPNCPISKRELCQLVWGDAARTETNLIEVTIRRLREKIEVNPSLPCFLLTARRVGYLFALPALA